MRTRIRPEKTKETVDIEKKIAELEKRIKKLEEGGK